MLKYKKSFLSLFTSLLITAVSAQTKVTDSAGKTGLMQSGGKIYVVMTIVITILAGLILYVIRLDRKITRLEKEGN